MVELLALAIIALYLQSCPDLTEVLENAPFKDVTQKIPLQLQTRSQQDTQTKQ